MKFTSVLGKSPSASFRDALLNGIAPDGSLYVPETLPQLPDDYFHRDTDRTYQDIAFDTLSLFIDEIPPETLRAIIGQALSFPISLVPLEPAIDLLELFHGPTLAFKDVGARFMAHALSYFLGEQKRDITILVATSGDTGSAVAHGFYNVPHITVYVLYPSGKISHLQEQQMTTLGGNIHAVEVKGTFDDCQRLVKQSLAEVELVRRFNLTTANSINLGRLLPQMTYYVWAYIQWQRHHSGKADKPIVVVPSGNFGNITAALYAKQTGTPMSSLVAATNLNDVVPEYFRSGIFTPRSSVQTYSNAMDVGNPSNLARIQALYKNDMSTLRNEMQALSILDMVTLHEIRRTYERTGYVLDPHTAVGVAAVRMLKGDTPFIVASTAHPAKFPDVIQKAIGKDIPVPPQLQDALNKPKLSTLIEADFSEWTDFLQRETSSLL